MSPNPDNENVRFQNDIQQEDQDQDDEEDSGFASGGRISSSHRVFSCKKDHEILMTNQRELLVCGFYYPELDSVRAVKLLNKCSVGTFLIRNSSDSRHLFSLSLKTQRGATSVRIAYSEGLFMFDCDERIRKRMPQFQSVLSLVDHHVKLSRQGVNNSWRWEEKSGRKNMVVDISKPYRMSVPSLKHLCVLEVNKDSDKWHFQRFCNPFGKVDLINCINNYPYRI